MPSASQRPGDGQQEIIKALMDNQKLLSPNSSPPALNFVRGQTVTQPTEKVDTSQGGFKYTESQPSTSKVADKKGDFTTGNYVTDPEEVTETPSSRTKVFKAEAPLREALTKIWEDARGAQVRKINLLSLRVFDSNDGFKLLGAINQVSGAEKQIKLSAEYETKNGSSFSMEFEGQVSDALPIKEFLQQQLRAAAETHLEIIFTLDYANGLDLNGDEPEKMTERLARFATGAAFVEAYAEAG